MDITEVKYFTQSEAKKTLPLVKRIVKDILEYSFQLKTISDSMGGDISGNLEAEKLLSELNSFMKELEVIGCYYKDWSFSVGLIDFPAVIDGEEVFLCWRSDEEDILHYHGVNEGYAGRKLIPDAYFLV